MRYLIVPMIFLIATIVEYLMDFVIYKTRLGNEHMWVKRKWAKNIKWL